MAAKRRQRFDVHGLVLLDKPTGLTSNDALQRVKNLYRARKAGHTGSLDPLASGLLPICLGEATKISSFLLDADKRYRVTCKLGVRTDSGDSDGQVVERHAVPELTKEGVEEVLADFSGPIEQIPPMYSAVKHRGQRLYDLARQGVEVERAARAVTIHELRLLSLAADELVLEVSCSKGTYVRVLAEDLGRVLGCGAHVSAMRRLGSGPYGESDMITLGELGKRAATSRDALLAVLKPIESALIHWPQVRLSDDAAHYLRQGQPVLVPRAPSDGWVRLYEGPDLESARFLGVGEILNDGRVAPRRLIRAA